MLTTQPPVQPMTAPLPPGQRHPRSTFQAVMGPNGIFTVFLAYWVATGLQDTYLKLGLVIATGLAAGHVFVGTILLLVNGRRVFPYVLEICMLVIYPVLLGVVYGSDGGYETVKRDYNFIVNSSLAGVSLISMIITWPLGIQHVQEMVPWAHAGHEDVLRAGYWTTGALSISFIASCLLYLIPVCKDVHNEHDNVLNLVFRLIMPEVLTFLAVLFTRFWPTSIVSTLQATEVYDWANQAVVLAYPPGFSLLNKPKVVDPAMLEPYPNPKLPAMGNNPLAAVQDVHSQGQGRMPGGMVLTGVPVDPLSSYYARKNNAIMPAPAISVQPQQGGGPGALVPMGQQGGMSGGMPLMPSGMVHPSYQTGQQQQQQQQQQALNRLMAVAQPTPPGTVRVPIPEGSVLRPIQEGQMYGGGGMGVAGMGGPAAVMNNQHMLMRTQQNMMQSQQQMMGSQQQMMQSQQQMMGNQQQLMGAQQAMLGGQAGQPGQAGQAMYGPQMGQAQMGGQYGGMGQAGAGQMGQMGAGPQYNAQQVYAPMAAQQYGSQFAPQGAAVQAPQRVPQGMAGSLRPVGGGGGGNVLLNATQSSGAPPPPPLGVSMQQQQGALGASLRGGMGQGAGMQPGSMQAMLPPPAYR